MEKTNTNNESVSMRLPSTNLAAMSEVQFRESLEALVMSTDDNECKNDDVDAFMQSLEACERQQESNIQVTLSPTRNLVTMQNDIPVVFPPALAHRAQAPQPEDIITSAIPSNFFIPSLTSFIEPIAQPSSTCFLMEETREFTPQSHETSSIGKSRKRHHGGANNGAISEDEHEGRKRREDRNAREQARSQLIAEKISQIRDLLAAANLKFKPDKYNILLTCEKYIKSLQDKAASLDSDLQNLLATLQRTSEITNPQYANVTGSDTSGSECGADDSDLNSTIDYKLVFQFCPFACAIMAIDGRFLDCNREFEQVTGFPRCELLPVECNASEHRLTKANLERTSSSTMSDMTEEGNNRKPPAVHSTQSNIGKKAHNLSIFSVLHRNDIENLFAQMSSMLQMQKKNEVDKSFSLKIRMCRSTDQLKVS
jgi:PAS domain-containing protein